jgi:phytoene synthase
MITEAYRHCETIVKEHSSSFYRAFGILPEEKRKAVWAVYGFCRTVDDLVDELEPDAAELQLGLFEQAFQRFLDGKPDADLIWVALADTFRRFPMDPLPFQHMIEGQRQDLVKKNYATMDELDRYCYLVAGTVGLMLLPILTTVRSDDMTNKAIRLGKAMQLTNILRDVAEDYVRGRIYLPADLMSFYQFQAHDIPQGVIASGWKPLYQHLYDMAEEHYQVGLSAGICYPRHSRLALAAAGLIYREILVESKRRHGNVFKERIRVSNKKKMGILISLLTQRETWKKLNMSEIMS